MSKIENDPSKGLNAAVGAALNAERVAAGLTFDDLAERSGISKATLFRLLSKHSRHIDVAVLETLAAEFGLTAPDVIGMAVARQERGSLRENLDAVREAMREPETKRKQA